MQGTGLIGLLARLVARWLHRLAARLDQAGRPRFAVAHARVPVPEALAQRFPGAPEHWLADIAWQMDEAGMALPPELTPADMPPGAEVQEPVPPQQIASVPRPTFGQPSSQRRPRPAVRFVDRARTSRPIDQQASSRLRRVSAMLHWPSKQSQQREPLSLASPADGTSPPVTWPQSEPSSLPLRPIWTATLRENAKHESQQIASSERAKSIPLTLPVLTSSSAQRPTFATAHRQSTSPVETFSTPVAAAPQLIEESWSAPSQSSRDAPAFDAPLPASRPPLSFVTSSSQRAATQWPTEAASRWPSLPPHEQTIADAAPSAPPLHDLVREQMVGSWSA